jgi:hypothetical protein
MSVRINFLSVHFAGRVLRLCRLMCDMVLPYRRRLLMIWGLRPDRWGTAPQQRNW